MNRRLWLQAAEVFDTWRVVPRMMLFGYAWFVYAVTMKLLDWYINQPAVARGVEESAMVAAIFTAVTGFSPWIFKIYVENGRNWADAVPDTVADTHVGVTTTVVKK